MVDTNAWSAEQHEAAKQEITLYKRELRPLIRDANLYHVSPRPDGTHWDGIEYWDSDRARGVLYAFRGSGAEQVHSFPLGGLQPHKHYRLRFHDHSSADRTATGSELMERGLKVTVALSNSSELIFFEEAR